MTTWYVIGSLVAMIALIGVMMAVTPWLQRKNECFAVTVPECAQKDARLLGMKKRYSAIMLALTAVCCAGFVAAALFGPDASTAQGAVALTVAVTVACLIPCAASFALMLTYRKRVRAIKKEEGWSVEGVQESAAVVGEDVPRPLSMWWNALYIPVVLFTLGIGIVGYPSMPDMVPMHMDFAGNVDSWAPKGPKVVLFPLAIQLFIAITFLFCHWSIIRSKKPTDPWSPATSSFAYGMFARAQSVFLFVSGVALTLVMGVSFQLASIGAISLMTAAVLIVLVSLFMVVGAIAMSVVYGQAGSRVFRKMQESDGLPFDDDEHWILGVFYYNKEDPSVFLPERFGVGWTINLARPAAWAIIAALTLVTVGFIALMFVLVGWQ